MKKTNTSSKPPATLLFWTLTDEVLERPEVLERQFHDIRQSGFGGVAAFVRCSRYTWHDQTARKALRKIGELCREFSMKNWIGPDPRFVSRELIGSSGGLEVLLFGDRARAEVFPNVSPVVDCRFSVRCDISPRHVHTLQEVAITYEPRGVERLYALRIDQDNATPVDIRDVTAHARFFFNAREHYVEAFGSLPARFREGQWQVLAFFRASTNHVDFASRQHMRRYLEMLADLKAEKCNADAVMWDEPGFTCTYGTLPYSPAIREAYRRSRGKGVQNELWKLALDAADGSHMRVRVGYHQAIQRTLNDANRRFTLQAKRLWGKSTVSGIHDTWHFESADMCDMNHGSLDLWQAARSKTGGFVDLGGIDKLRDAGSPWNAHLAAMSVICASLGKLSPGKYAYNNLWTVGDDNGEGWQATVMDHCVNTMALFGTRWLAHCYGPVGTIGEERSFLGSPPMPGYPDHSTWRFFPIWNRRLRAHLETVGHRLPSSNVLLIFPVEDMYGLAGQRADREASAIFELLLALLDDHYHVDVFSPSACRGARWEKGTFRVGRSHYQAVIAPLTTSQIFKTLRLSPEKPVYYFDPLEGPDEPGRRMKAISDLLKRLADVSGLRPVTAPAGSWVTMTEIGTGTVVTLSPSRHRSRYRGGVSMQGQIVDLQEARDGLTRIHFPRIGRGHILRNGEEFSMG